MLTVKKCDNGVPLPEGSLGTWFTWDVWDEEQQRSVSQHDSEGQAKVAAETLSAAPELRPVFEEALRRRCSHSAVLDALVYVYTHLSAPKRSTG